MTHYMTELNKHKFPNSNSFIPRSSEIVDEDKYLFIPVVVHIIHDNGPENISDERVLSQIETLNQDFGHYGSHNDDDRGEDTRIRFCLAQMDPDGNATSGIIRVQSPFTDLDSDDEMLTKNLSRWDAKNYLNIWVVKSIDGDEQTQGYSYLPRHAQGPIYEGDGIIITYKYFGKISSPPTYYDLGRTTTHEVGHYLDLLHPWGGDKFEGGEGGCNDDDGIDDTPVCSLDFYAFYPSCETPQQCNTIRMTENFMDYSTDRCMSLFTPGQGTYMRSTISKYRSVLVSFDNIVNRGCLNLYDSLNCSKRIKLYPNPVELSQKKLKFEIPCREPYDLQVFVYDFYGRMVLEKTFSKVSDEEVILDLITLRPGMYYVIGNYETVQFQKKIILGNMLNL